MLHSLLAAALFAAVAPAADPPPEFALVPADAAGVVHVRIADLWNNPAMADYRTSVRRAGDKALAALDEQFVPAPSSIDRLTGIVLLPPAGGDPQVVVVARFNQPFAAAKVRAAYMPQAKAETAGGKEFYVDAEAKVAVHFADAQTLIFSDRAGMAAYLDRKPAAGGKLAKFLADHAGKPLVIAANVKAIPIPPDALKQIPPDFKPILDAELATFTVSLDGTAQLALRLVYAGADEATAADVALRKGLKLLKPFVAQQRAEMEKALFGKAPEAGGFRPLAELPEAVAAVAGLGSLAEFDALLDNPPVKRVGDALTAEMSAPFGLTGTVAVTSIGVGLLLPAVQKVREAAARAQSQNNLKQIGLAIHNYESANNVFPPAAITDKKSGKRLLSWRVAVLPYIEQQALYQQFKLDEPWDSPNNLPLSKVMIKVYTDPRANDPAAPGLTYYKAFVGKDVVANGKRQPGPDALWSWSFGRSILGITDGTSNTAMVGAFGPPVVWTKPDDFEYDPKQPLPDLFAPFAGLNVLFGDGSVRFLAPTIDEKILRAMITAQGGEVFSIP